MSGCNCNSSKLCSLTVQNSTLLNGNTVIKHLTVPPRNLRMELFDSQIVHSDYTNYTQILFDNVVTNTLNPLFNTSTVILKEAGTYAITASIEWEDNPSNTRQVVVQISDYLNNPLYSFGCSTNVFGFQDLTTTSATLLLPEKARISVFARQVAGVSIDALATKSTFLEINQLV